MKNKTGIKVSELVHVFIYDLQSNVGIRLKESSMKRVRLSKSECMDYIVKYFKLNNTGYQELINTIIKNGSK